MGDVLQFPKAVKTEVEKVVEEAKAEMKALGLDTTNVFQGAVKEAGKAAEATKQEVKAAAQEIGATLDKAEGVVESTAATMEQRARASQEFIMNLINKNRREGIITLAEKVENLSKRTENFVENGLENAFREVQTALNATLTHLQASSSLTEYLKHDIVACIQNLEQHAASMMHMSGYIQTLIALLVEKGMITHEEMEGMWNKVARPGLEALKQAQEAEQKPEPPKAG